MNDQIKTGDIVISKHTGIVSRVVDAFDTAGRRILMPNKSRYYFPAEGFHQLETPYLVTEENLVQGGKIMTSKGEAFIIMHLKASDSFDAAVNSGAVYNFRFDEWITYLIPKDIDSGGISQTLGVIEPNKKEVFLSENTSLSFEDIKSLYEAINSY